MIRNIKKQFSNVNSFGVIGCGQMGTGIAVVASRVAGLNVKVVDMNQDLLSKSRKFTENLLEKEIQKGRLSSEDRYKVLERMSYSTKLEDLD